MAGFPLELPMIQNWSCHSCSGCCRQHAITITEEEKSRIEQQEWTEADGIPVGQSLFKRVGSWLGKRSWRLAHQPDGACVFLNEEGLCRIHAKFGEPAKPLACRIYPYAFHPKGKKLAVSLRFSCPTVVKNGGTSVARQKQEINEIARLVVPEKALESQPPSLNKKCVLEWNDLLTVVSALNKTVANDSAQLAVRLLRVIHWIDLLDQAELGQFTGERLSELVEILVADAESQFPTEFDFQSIEPPSSLGKTQFRQLVGQYAREDSGVKDHGRWSDRWRLFKAAIAFTRGIGDLPLLQECFRRVPFDRLESSFGSLPNEADEILTRYFSVKITGMHFCGRGFYGASLVEGVRSLVLMYPAVLWLARWLAASEDRNRLTADDIAQGLAIADHHHGFSPALGTFYARGRVRSLAQMGDIARLCCWYTR